MIPLRSGAAVLLTCAALAACASEQEQPYRPPNRPDRPRPTIFLSPAGQPFHAAAGEPYPVAKWFAQADRDHDGRISREEFRADFEAFFRTVDANHDGVIDSFELDDYEHKIAPEILSVLERPGVEAPSTQNDGEIGQGQTGGERGGHRHHGDGPQELDAPARQDGGPVGQNSTLKLSALGASAYSLLDVSEPVASADADFDGKVTLAEFLAAADRRFDQLDTKRLGYLTLQSLPRTPDQVAVEGQKPKAP
jgi:hypothetical protein